MYQDTHTMAAGTLTKHTLHTGLCLLLLLLLVGEGISAPCPSGRFYLGNVNVTQVGQVGSTGVYVRMPGVEHNNRPVYKHTNRQLHLYFTRTPMDSFWVVAPNVISNLSDVIFRMTSESSEPISTIDSRWQVKDSGGWVTVPKLRTVCVDENFGPCTSGKINVTGVTSQASQGRFMGTYSLHNISQSLRPMYVKDGGPEVLYYGTHGLWVFSRKIGSNSIDMFTKDSALLPEFILEKWAYFNGFGLRSHHLSISCLGSAPRPDTFASSLESKGCPPIQQQAQTSARSTDALQHREHSESLPEHGDSSVPGNGKHVVEGNKDKFADGVNGNPPPAEVHRSHAVHPAPATAMHDGTNTSADSLHDSGPLLARNGSVGLLRDGVDGSMSDASDLTGNHILKNRGDVMNRNASVVNNENMANTAFNDNISNVRSEGRNSGRVMVSSDVAIRASPDPGGEGNQKIDKSQSGLDEAPNNVRDTITFGGIEFTSEHVTKAADSGTASMLKKDIYNDHIGDLRNLRNTSMHSDIVENVDSDSSRGGPSSGSSSTHEDDNAAHRTMGEGEGTHTARRPSNASLLISASFEAEGALTSPSFEEIHPSLIDSSTDSSGTAGQFSIPPEESKVMFMINLTRIEEISETTVSPIPSERSHTVDIIGPAADARRTDSKVPVNHQPILKTALPAADSDRPALEGSSGCYEGVLMCENGGTVIVTGAEESRQVACQCSGSFYGARCEQEIRCGPAPTVARATLEEVVAEGMLVLAVYKCDAGNHSNSGHVAVCGLDARWLYVPVCSTDLFAGYDWSEVEP